MREIKFRAWDEKTKEFYCQQLSTTWAIGRFFDFLPVHAILEQFTGLYDSTGHEIFEGDLVDCLVGSEEHKNVEVVFCDGAFSLQLRDDYIPALYEAFSGDIEIIGNIHERGE